ncbi:hypothetical protein E2C01_022368 [Portunus trituberculatus]|uniref:Uncharacterized protein n=1 Tax=Portunus trituberculatus TaxID=210409 RepID=A0A5B7E5T8_PORTR|nr:hypothetical protein [Portunus trituberculatus]
MDYFLNFVLGRIQTPLDEDPVDDQSTPRYHGSHYLENIVSLKKVINVVAPGNALGMTVIAKLSLSVHVFIFIRMSVSVHLSGRPFLGCASSRRHN